MFIQKKQLKPLPHRPENAMHWNSDTQEWMEFNWVCGKTQGKQSCRECLSALPEAVYPHCMGKHYL